MTRPGGCPKRCSNRVTGMGGSAVFSAVGVLKVTSGYHTQRGRGEEFSSRWLPAAREIPPAYDAAMSALRCLSVRIAIIGGVMLGPISGCGSRAGLRTDRVISDGGADVDVVGDRVALPGVRGWAPIGGPTDLNGPAAEH